MPDTYSKRDYERAEQEALFCLVQWIALSQVGAAAYRTLTGPYQYAVDATQRPIS